MKHLLKAALIATVVASSAPLASAETLDVRQCKSYVQGRIDVLDAELHKGKQPDAARKLVKRRDKLKAQRENCARNPRAYKKDI